MDSNEMSTDWVSVKVFMNDLWSFSEIETPVSHDEEVATPAHILEYNARVGANNNRSIFDNPSPTDDVTFVYSGRGRGGRSTMIRPGAAPVPNNTDFDVRRRLREVSGLGYSNELIEESFKVATGTSTGISNSNTDSSSSNIKLQPVPSTSSASSSRSTPSRKSRVQTPVSSKRSSPSATTSSRTTASTASNLSESSCSSRSATPPDVAEVEFVDAGEVACSTPGQPLPLSVMLNRAKRDMRKAKEDASKAPVANGRLEAEENIETDQNTSSELNAEARVWLPNGNHADNDYWWNRELEVSRDEANSWRRRDTNSPNRFFVWNKNSTHFDISSSKEFPALK